METASLETSPVFTQRPTPPTIPAVGFNNNGRVAERNNALFAALLAIASHDLRQPLQVIMGAHDILAKSLGGGVERRQLARVGGATTQLSKKLDELVEALRLFEPASAALEDAVELGPIFAQAQAEFLEPARLRGITLRIIPTGAAVSSNAVLLRGILHNLIRNAIDYTPQGGRVLIAARRRGAAVHLEVRDNGIGIPATELAEIFKPFHRADTTRVDGLGLGLFIVKSAAAFLGHPVEVRSMLGKGSCFLVVTAASVRS